MNLVTANHKVPWGFAHALWARGEENGERESERETEEREMEARVNGRKTRTARTEKERRERERAHGTLEGESREVFAVQKARMQAKKEERNEETGFFQLGQVGASNLRTAASLRE